jgi:hypothetical protein
MTSLSSQSRFAERYPRVKEGTISAHLIRMSTNATSRMHYNAKPGDDDLLFQLDGGRFRLYDPATDPPPIYEKPKGPGASPPPPDGPAPEPPSEFAYESDLRDFLERNLSLLEPGLRLYQEEGITGVEFPVGGRFIDILALDAKNDLVVVELKVSRDYDRVVGQLLRYIGWIRQHQAEAGQHVRGIIVLDRLLLKRSRLLRCHATVVLEEPHGGSTVGPKWPGPPEYGGTVCRRRCLRHGNGSVKHESKLPDVALVPVCISRARRPVVAARRLAQIPQPPGACRFEHH